MRLLTARRPQTVSEISIGSRDSSVATPPVVSGESRVVKGPLRPCVVQTFTSVACYPQWPHLHPFSCTLASVCSARAAPTPPPHGFARAVASSGTRRPPDACAAHSFASLGSFFTSPQCTPSFPFHSLILFITSRPLECLLWRLLLSSYSKCPPRGRHSGNYALEAEWIHAYSLYISYIFNMYDLCNMKI